MDTYLQYLSRIPKWKVTTVSGQVIKNGQATLNLDTLNEAHRHINTIQNNINLILELASQRTVEIKNTSGHQIKIRIGDNHTYTTQELSNNQILQWTFYAFHVSFPMSFNTHHWATVSSEQNEICRISVYGNGDGGGDVPENNNKFHVKDYEICRSFGRSIPISFD